jgi:hypothetical protein
VVDTNVGMAANDHPDRTCRIACIAALQEAQATRIVVIDDSFRILSEYIRNMPPDRQPGAGIRFVQWLLQNQRNPTVCERVRITSKPGVDDDFEEFPDDPELEAFDRGDRKFVAVARASVNNPTILNAVDTRSWPKYKEHLARHGVQIECLCPHLMQG